MPINSIVYQNNISLKAANQLRINTVGMTRNAKAEICGMNVSISPVVVTENLRCFIPL